MAFLVVGKIQVPETQYEWIQSIRKKHDEAHFKIIYPHFTLVFPTDKITREAFISDI